VQLQMFVMVRPRGGDSLYTEHEFQTMQCDIAQARSLGADGVVLGLLDIHGRVDVERTRQLVELADPMQVTFHRAFDMSSDLDESLGRVIETGAHRILTSGGMPSVEHGAQCVARLVRAAQGKIRIMAGSGLRHGNIHRIAAQTGAWEFHSSLRRKVDGPMVYRNSRLKLGAVAEDEFSRYIVLEEDVRRLRRALDSMATR
jgi:copper homeostasis protein